MVNGQVKNFFTSFPSHNSLSAFNPALHTFQKGVDAALWDLNHILLVWLSNEVMNKQK